VTTSTTALQAQLRTRLLAFQTLDGDTLADTIGRTETGPGVVGRLYWDQAPQWSPTAIPPTWGVLSLKNRRRDAEQAEREMAELEVMLFGRPRTVLETLELAGDIIEQAMLRYVDATVGLVGCWGSLRNALPPFPAPADRDLAQIQLVFTLVLWPAYKTQYHDQPRG
jgi:hypothetical protein